MDNSSEIYAWVLSKLRDNTRRSAYCSSPVGSLSVRHKQEAAGQSSGSCWTAIAVSWLSNKTRKRRESERARGRAGVPQALLFFFPDRETEFT